MTDRQAMIRARAIIRKEMLKVERQYKRARSLSFKEESSDSYDQMQRKTGEESGLRFALLTIEELLKKQRRLKT